MTMRDGSPGTTASEPRASRAPGHGPLCVGIRVAPGPVPAWFRLLLDALVASDGERLLEITVIARDAAGRGGAVDAPTGPGLRALGLLDQRVFGQRAAMYASFDLESWATGRGIPLGGGGTLAGRQAAESTDTPTADIVLDLTGGAPAPRADGGRDQRIWWLDGLPHSPGWPGVECPELARSVIRGSTALTVELMTHGPAGSAPVVLARATSPAHPCSPAMAAAFLAVSAEQLVVGELRKASQASLHPDAAAPGLAAPHFGSATTTGRQTPAPDRVSAGGRRAAIPVTAAYAGRSLLWTARRLGWVQQWRLQAGPRTPGDLGAEPSALRTTILPPRGHFWADPHAIDDGGAVYVFFEDFDYAAGRGGISALTIDAEGRPGPYVRALEADSHLSYPFVFRHRERVYMVPENAESGGVDLYEAVRLPDTWTLRRRLVTGKRLVDATLFEWDGKWWMFASLQQPFGLRGADALVLYMSDDPVEGEWTEHPESPVMADVTRSRPAGAPFVHEGRLYRPGQDGSRGYGWGIAVNEVLSLTPSHYAERRVHTVTPPPGRGVCGTHTMSLTDSLAVMDVCRWVPRRAARPEDE